MEAGLDGDRSRQTDGKQYRRQETRKKRKMDGRRKIPPSHHIFPSHPRLHSRDGGLKHLTCYAPHPWPHTAPVSLENSVSRGTSRPPIFVSITPPCPSSFPSSYIWKWMQSAVLCCVVLRCVVLCRCILWCVLLACVVLGCVASCFSVLCCVFVVRC